MAYGTLKCDNIVFDNGGTDKLVTVSGLFFSTSGALTVTGTISGGNVTAPTATFTTLTGTTTTGTTATFTSGSFTTLTGTTVTGTTANFVSGVFTTQISGATITGTTVAATTGNYTSLTGTTTTGTTANFVSGVFTTQVSGTTITGTTVATTTGSFVSLTGTTATFTSGIIASGTAALPSLAILSDPNTGIYSPGADQLAISTNGTQRLSVNANGTLSSTSAVAATASFTGPANAYIDFTDGTGIFRTQLSSNTPVIGAASNHGLIFTTNNTERLRINPAGLVGIGTSSPGNPLTVFRGAGTSAYIESVGNANTANPMLIGQDSAGVARIWQSGDNALGFWTNSLQRLTINGSGNVGIGTSSPSGMLDVSGSSFVRFSNSTAPTLSNDTHAGEALFIRSGGSAGDGNVQAVLALGKADGSSFRSGAAIGSVQTATDTDQVGLAFYTSGSTGSSQTLSERVRVTHAGNVGIGTTSPGATLDVSGTVNFKPAAGYNVLFQQSGTALRINYLNDAGSANVSALYRATDFAWQKGDGGEVARIDSSGRLLVGTSSARSNFENSTLSAAVQIEGTNYAGSRLALIRNGGGGGINLCATGGASVGSNTAVSSSATLGEIVFAGSDGSEFVNAASISTVVDGTPGDGDMPGRLVFSTTADGAPSPTERMRITSAGVLQIADAGNITVGTTTGTKIGTATTQKLGFYNATPVVQPTAVANATTAVDVITQLNDLLAKLRTLGIIAT